MATSMKAAVVRQFGQPLSIDQLPVAEPGFGQVLIKVIASGDWPVKPALPFIREHEAIGSVAKVGKGVLGLKEGDVVGVPWLHDACGCCEYCTTGWETLCESQHNTGYSVDGGYAEYAIAAAPYAGRIPASADLIAMAPILCAGVTTYKGLKETEARPGEWVFISGIGRLGHVAVQYAKAWGCASWRSMSPTTSSPSPKLSVPTSPPTPCTTRSL